MNAAIATDLEELAATLRASTVAVRVGRSGAGSGVIWSNDGTIVTNAHVAAEPRAEVVLSDGRRYRARLERRDPRRDLAVLRIDAPDLVAAQTRDPGSLRVGELVVALGHPLGVPNALAVGIVHGPAGRGRRGFVRADLQLAPGNSGGPLADAAGRVVGICAMVWGPLALAIPTSAVERFISATAGGERRAA